MSDAPALRGLHAPLGGAAARAAFVAWVDEVAPEPRVFLEARVRALAAGRYEIRHRADAMRPYASMQRVSADPYDAREIAQTDAAGAHRPLKTAPSLRRGWVLTDLDAVGLGTALDYLYPACVAHWHAGRTGTLRVTHWPETARRQSGIYAAVGLLPARALPDAVWACCDDVVCLRHVAWDVAQEGEEPTDAFQTTEPPPADYAPGPDGVVPCPEACSIFISFARKLVTLEREPRREVPGLGALSAAEIEQLRQLAAAAAHDRAVGDDVREGEFDEPLNRRRLRYLAARLATDGGVEQRDMVAASRSPAA